MMNDVNPRGVFATQTNHHFYRLVFRCPRPGAQKRLVIFCCRLCFTFLDWTRYFSVNNQNCAQLCQHRHRLTKVCLRYIREFIDARMDQETFESDHTCSK